MLLAWLLPFSAVSSLMHLARDSHIQHDCWNGMCITWHALDLWGLCHLFETWASLAGVIDSLLQVYTLGAGSTEANLMFDPLDPPFPLYRTERGGEVTFHGPGQLVLYPILNLRSLNPDLHWYMRCLEEVVIRYCHHFYLFCLLCIQPETICGLQHSLRLYLLSIWKE